MTIIETKDGWDITVSVTNTGNTSGKDVVQIYVKAPQKGLDKPERELKGFAKTPLLAPGETYEVKISVSKESLASYDESAEAWITEKGKYTFIAGTDSLDSSLKGTIIIR